MIYCRENSNNVTHVHVFADILYLLVELTCNHHKMRQKKYKAIQFIHCLFQMLQEDDESIVPVVEQTWTV